MKWFWQKDEVATVGADDELIMKALDLHGISVKDNGWGYYIGDLRIGTPGVCAPAYWNYDVSPKVAAALLRAKDDWLRKQKIDALNNLIEKGTSK